MTTTVTRMWSKNTGKVTTDRNLRRTASFVEGWQILTDDPTLTKVQIFDLPDLPATGTPYPGLSQIFLQEREVEQLSPIYWLATMRYFGEFGEAGANSPATNSRPILKWTDTEADEEIDQDWDGNAIVNNNNEPIRGVTMKVADTVLTIQRNMAFFNPWTTSQYRHSTNSDTFKNFPAGTGRMIRFSADEAWDEANNGYYKVNAAIQFRYPYNTTPARAWWARTLHQGYTVRAAPGEEPTRAWNTKTKDWETQPVLLKTDGTRETDPQNAVWLEWQRYGSLPYNALGLLT